jgi:hypothetical protein
MKRYSVDSVSTEHLRTLEVSVRLVIEVALAKEPNREGVSHPLT